MQASYLGKVSQVFRVWGEPQSEGWPFEETFQKLLRDVGNRGLEDAFVEVHRSPIKGETDVRGDKCHFHLPTGTSFAGSESDFPPEPPFCNLRVHFRFLSIGPYCTSLVSCNICTGIVI